MSADFAAASKQKVRFNTSRGQLSVEDLWDLPLTSPTGRSVNLNDIAKGISREIKEAGDEDFVDDVQKPNALLALKLDLVKHVISVKKAERDAADQAAKKAMQKQKILEIIDSKQNKELEEKSIEGLRSMLNA